jgi:hypothetical protein
MKVQKFRSAKRQKRRIEGRSAEVKSTEVKKGRRAED